MPFTPFHMGPGLLIKSLAGRHFSLMIFGFSQVAMDTEVLVHMIRGDEILHGFNHTYIGGTVVALISILIGRPCCQLLLSRWITQPGFTLENWIRGSKDISAVAAISGALLGTYSHIILDSIMHFDLHPLMPRSEENRLLNFISFERLHLLCIASGCFGGIILLSSYYLVRAKRNDG